VIELAVPLTQKQIQVATELHDTLDQWRISDNALRRLRRVLPGFDEEACLLKSIAVNQLYGTRSSQLFRWPNTFNGSCRGRALRKKIPI
jgi:hypothetical protein